MTLRISGGQFKGRKTASQKIFSKKDVCNGLRPTSAKVREAVFDILRNDIKNAAFVDLYAGTGTVGLEALSRGAVTAFFVESNYILFKALSACIKNLGISDRAHIYREQAVAFLKMSSSSDMRFDIIFADPPYASAEIGEMAQFIDGHGVLNKGGCLIVEHSSKTALQETMQSLKFIKNYRYGDTMLTLYRKGQ